MHDPNIFKIKKLEDNFNAVEAEVSAIREEFEHSENDFPVGSFGGGGSQMRNIYLDNPEAYAWKVSIWEEASPWIGVFSPTIFVDGIEREIDDLPAAIGDHGFLDEVLGYAPTVNGDGSVTGGKISKYGFLYCRVIYKKEYANPDDCTSDVEYTFDRVKMVFCSEEERPEDEEWCDLPICFIDGRANASRIITQIQVGPIYFSRGGKVTGGGGGTGNPNDYNIHVSIVDGQAWLTQGVQTDASGCATPVRKILRLDNALFTMGIETVDEGECGCYRCLGELPWCWSKAEAGNMITDVDLSNYTRMSKIEYPTLREYEVKTSTITVDYPESDTNMGCVYGESYSAQFFAVNAPSTTSGKQVYFYTELASINKASESVYIDDME